MNVYSSLVVNRNSAKHSIADELMQIASINEDHLSFVAGFGSRPTFLTADNNNSNRPMRLNDLHCWRNLLRSITSI